MVVNRRNTQWSIGPGAFAMAVPPGLAGHAGVLVEPLAVDPSVGEEMVVVALDPALDAEAFERAGSVRLELASGLVTTRSGPVGYVAWGLVAGTSEDADSASCLLSLHELAFDPHEPEHRRAFDALDGQTHWHLFVVGSSGRVDWVAELANTFELRSAVDCIERAASVLPGGDFEAARRQAAETYPLDERWLRHRRRVRIRPSLGELRSGDVEGTARRLAALGAGPLAGHDRIGAVDLDFGAIYAAGGAESSASSDMPAAGAEVASAHPDVRRWVEALFREVPDLFFFLDPKALGTLHVTLALAPLELDAQGRLAVAGAGPRRLVYRALSGIHARLAEAGLGDEDPAVRRHVDALSALWGA